ncbi:hypothetical protein Scep_008768 [Stephania cephalantha]|uniref:Uncharacterized protein n=1 Tax=Stephania cephalantha TaxID=152367 RepID=A0AAP0PCH1_9MAGN
MERVACKLLIMLAVFLVAFASTTIEGARTLKTKEKADQPQSFLGGPGGFGNFPPLPPFGSGSFGFNPTTFCSFPGARCAPPTTSIPYPPTISGNGNGKSP